MPITFRKFVISVTNENNKTGYVKKVSKLSLGYQYSTTNDIKKAQQWLYRNSAKSMCKKLEFKKDPTYITRATIKHKYDIVETTETVILRLLKLKKLFKND